MTLNASATSCYRIKCLDKVSSERIYDLTGARPLAININLTTTQVPWPHLDAWRRMLTFYIVWALPPLPTGKDSQRDCIRPFLFLLLFEWLLVKTTRGWPLRSSAEMVHEIQVYLIIVGQPESSQLKFVSSGLGLGQCARCHKKVWVDPFLELAGKGLMQSPWESFPMVGRGEGRGLSRYKVKC